MERRSEFRWRSGQPCKVTILSGDQRTLSGTALDISGRGMALWLPGPVPIGSPVKGECDRFLVLGDVTYCRPEAEGFRVGLVLAHRCGDLMSLVQLREAISPESPPVAEPSAGTAASDATSPHDSVSSGPPRR